LSIQPEHEFWPDSLQLAEVARAIVNGGRLATVDRGALSLIGAKGNVELIVS
jgi:hypothetical protein